VCDGHSLVFGREGRRGRRPAFGKQKGPPDPKIRAGPFALFATTMVASQTIDWSGTVVPTITQSKT
jgi:hypothetical protein